MQSVQINENYIKANSIGRKEKQKIIRKRKTIEKLTKAKVYIFKLGVVILIFLNISMLTYIIISERQKDKFLINIQNDNTIPSVISRKIVEYFN